MPSLREELRQELLADQDPRITCRLCTWLKSQPPDVQAEWDAILADRASFTHASVSRALKRREANLTDNSVMNHRGKGHRT